MNVILHTHRLRVRQFTTADLDALHAICGDRRTMRYVGDGMVLDRGLCARWLDETLVDYASSGRGAWALELDATPGVVGYGGIVSARRRADPELIYALRPDLWGRGLASELVPALVAHAWQSCGLRRLVALVHPDNGASMRVLEKAGLHCAGEELGPEGVGMLVYVIENPDRAGRREV